MATVDPLYAQWLQGVQLWAARVDLPTQALWGDRAASTERPTGIARRGDAEAEGDRQLAFFRRGPFVVDDVQVLGVDWHREIGRVVTIAAGQFSYAKAVDAFILEVEVTRATGLTVLTVLLSLAELG